MRRRGITLIETLLFIGVFATIISIVSLLFINSIRVAAKVRVISEVEQQGEFAMFTILSEIRNAEGLTSPAAGSASTLVLDHYDALRDPTTISLGDGRLTIAQGAGAAIPFTSNRVVASNVLFENVSSPGTPGTVVVQLTLSYLNPQDDDAYEYEKTFYGSATLR